MEKKKKKKKKKRSGDAEPLTNICLWFKSPPLKSTKVVRPLRVSVMQKLLGVCDI